MITKGNWKVEDKPNSNLKHITCRETSNWYIAEEILEGDAKLIAAAPELLEACKEMYEWFKNERTDSIQDDALELAKKAINKALK